MVITDGRISEVGSYEELISRQGEFSKFLQKHFTEQGNEDDELEDDEGKAYF